MQYCYNSQYKNQVFLPHFSSNNHLKAKDICYSAGSNPLKKTLRRAFQSLHEGDEGGKSQVYFTFFNPLNLAVFQSGCMGELVDAHAALAPELGEMLTKRF